VGAVAFGARMRAAHEDPEARRYDEPWQAVAVGAGIGFVLGAYAVGRFPRERWVAARLRD
jgi:ElaB/YqjD/DUF883 family membrane-anchored ribosome-binding protein